MGTKLWKLRELHAKGDKIGALRIAAKFQRLGDEKEAITKGWSAHGSADFYRQIGQDPDSLVEGGIKAMEVKYGL